MRRIKKMGKITSLNVEDLTQYNYYDNNYKVDQAINAFDIETVQQTFSPKN